MTSGPLPLLLIAVAVMELVVVAPIVLMKVPPHQKALALLLTVGQALALLGVGLAMKLGYINF